MTFGVDRLTVRLAAGIALLVVAALGVGFYLLSRHNVSYAIEARRRAAELQNRLLETALRHQMPERDLTVIEAIVQEIGTQPEIQGAMILDHEGRVRFASDRSLVGQQFSRDSETCTVCHQENPVGRPHWAVLGPADGGYLRSVEPIRNGPECHQCHDPSRRVNGILILDVSLAEVQAQIARENGWVALGVGALGFILLVSVGLLVRRLILARLVRLGATARSIAAGHLGDRAEIRGDDTITQLSYDFNNMANAVVGLVTEIQAQEAQLVGIMNSLGDGLVVLDRESRVVAANQAFCRRLGVVPEAIKGKPCLEAIGHKLPCTLGGPPCPGVCCLSKGEAFRTTFHIKGADGEAGRVEEVDASPVFGADGEIVQVVEIWRDITERVAEETRLAEIERLESLGVLASGFSHEVNTPLASTLACAESIIARIDEHGNGGGNGSGTGAEGGLPEIREGAETIRNEVLRCKKITERFLRFARGIPPAAEPVLLSDVIQSVVSLVAPTARQAGVAIRVEADGGIPMVMANTEVCQHVLLNLLVNAIHSFDGGARGGSVVVGHAVGSDVRLRIRDAGRGIDPEEQRHLFEPFRTHRPGGTGVGLFLSRQFMRRFGGDVRLVESKAGEGSTFEIVFLRAREDA